MAGLSHIPAVIRDATDAETLELALVENLLREDLNPMEEAEAYQRLLTEFAWTQEDLGQRVGKDRSSVANCLRLLKLPELIQADLRAGRLTMGHARALLSLASPAEQLKLREEILAQHQLCKGSLMRELDRLQRAAARLGCALPSPFATLSFMALPVIPALKLTDLGLVDVNTFDFVPV